jgi:hypothetical protein
MIAVVTILSAFPLGYFLSNRLAANTTYAIAYLWAFVFQGTYLMLDSLDGGTNPAFETSKFPLSYGVVTLAIFAVGFAIVQLGHRVGRGRRQRRQASSRPSTTGPIPHAASGNTAHNANAAG